MLSSSGWTPKAQPPWLGPTELPPVVASSSCRESNHARGLPLAAAAISSTSLEETAVRMLRSQAGGIACTASGAVFWDDAPPPPAWAANGAAMGRREARADSATAPQEGGGGAGGGLAAEGGDDVGVASLPPRLFGSTGSADNPWLPERRLRGGQSANVRLTSS